MRTIPTLRFGLVALGALLVCPPARADIPDSRFGLVPAVGGGMAVLTSPGTLPGFIGFTTLGGELFGQLRRWGLYLRFEFLSSGNDGRWTAYSGGAGVSYRFMGDANSVSLFGRAGGVFEYWIGQQVGGCSILLFVPNSCTTQGMVLQTTQADNLGVSAGVRLEIPIRSVYLAVGASYVPVFTVASSTGVPGVATSSGNEPGAALQLRFDLELGFRDTRNQHQAVHDPNEHRGMSY